MSNALAARLGVQISPEAIRVVALDEKTRSKLLGHAEIRIEANQDPGAALLEALARTGCVGPAAAVVLGAEARHIHVRVPRMSSKELRDALQMRATRELGEPPESYLIANRSSPFGPDGQREILSLLIPREPLESYAQQMLAVGCPLEWVSTAALLELDWDDARPEVGRLWAHVGGSRTCLTLATGREIAITREIPRKISDEDDLMAAVERRLADFQEIERSILYFRDNYNRNGIEKVTLCGGPDEVHACRDQYLPPMRELEIEVDADDAWKGIDRGDRLPQSLASRLSMAARAAKSRPAIAVTPEVTRASRRRRLSWLIGAAACISIACGAVATAASKQLERNDLRDEVTLAEERRDTLGELAADEPGRSEPALEVRPVPVHDWSGVLREIGLLAETGIDYDRIELRDRRPAAVVLVEGRAHTRSTEETGALLAGFFEGLRSSPYSLGLPSLEVAAGPVGVRGESVHFSISGEVRGTPQNEEEVDV